MKKVILYTTCIVLSGLIWMQPLKVSATEIDAKTGSEADTKTDSKTDSEVGTKIETNNGAKDNAKTGSDIESKADTKTGSDVELKTDVKTGSDTELKADAKSDTDTVVKAALAPVGANSLFQSTLTEDEYKEAADQAKGATFGYTHLGICNVEENNLNIRKEPNESGRLAGKLPKNAACEVIQEEDGWVLISSGKVQGYVKKEFLLTGYGAVKRAQELATPIAVVTTDALKIREQPNTDCEVITTVPNGEILDVAEEQSDGWVRVYLDDDEFYVSAEYVEVKTDLATAITMTELLYGEGISDIRVDLCTYAKQFLGNPYVWGGTSLTKGADCSGFVQSVFKNYNVKLPRSSREQANAGTKISTSELRAGDLVFYARGGTIDHVAIYIGNGQVVHASSKKTGIKISTYNYRTIAKAVRVLQD